MDSIQTTSNGIIKKSSKNKRLDKNKKSTCTQCNKIISASNLAIHLQTHFPEVNRTKFKCSFDQCSKIYSNQGNLNQHVKALHSSTPRRKFKCDLCSKEYNTKFYLKQHILQFHSGSYTEYGCTLCDAVFKSKQGRNYHVVTKHTGEKAFQCEECPINFPTSGLLRSHRVIHSDEKPYACSSCSKQFKLRAQLSRHIRNMHLPRTNNFECSTCQKIFNTRSTLSRHAKIHNLRGAFFCYFCKKDFFRRTHLYNHLRIHTLEMPFFCPEGSCKFSCAISSTLRRHKKCHDSSDPDQITRRRTLSCYFCSKTFPESGKLQIHVRNHTLEEPFPCGLCTRSFKCTSRLKSHISTHTKEKPYRCTHCGKCFSQSGHLIPHLATHTGEKRFFCEFCSYSSFTKGKMSRHYLQRHKISKKCD